MSERKAEVLMTAAIIACSTSFVFSKMGLSTMGAFNILAARFLLAFILLFALLGKKMMGRLDRCTVLGGALVGVLFFLVMSCEMLALKTARAGTVSLLENLAIILVPLLESALHRIRPKAMGLLCAAIAVGGVAMLALKGGGFRLGAGECIALLAAFLCAVAIITTEHISHKADGSVLGVLGMGFLGLYALLASFLFESPRLPQTGGEWGIIAALSVVCTGFGYTLQPIARSHIGADRASLFCTLSPVFTTILGAIVLRERTAPLDYVAMLLILGSSLLLYLPRLHRKSRARAVLFDMDGTLLDTLEDMQDSVNHVLMAHGYPARTLEEVRAFVGNGAGKLMRRALPDTVGEEEFAALLTEYKAWYQAHNCIKTRPYPGIPELLDRLRKFGVQVAIVSNKPDPTTKALAQKFFPGVPAFGQRDDLPPKPAPDLVLCALKELGCPRDSAIYVGDSEVDIQTAQNCTMKYIGVSWGFRGREKLLAASPRATVVDRAEEILQGKNLQLVH